MKYKIIIFTVVGILMLLAVSAFIFGKKPGANEKASLEFWGTDPSSYWTAIISAYQTANPNITIKYVQKNPSSYENAAGWLRSAGPRGGRYVGRR